MTAETPRPSKREEARAALIAYGSGLKDKGEKAAQGLKKAVTLSSETASNIFSISRRGLVTVDGLTVTFPVLPEKSGVVVNKKTISVRADQLENQLTLKEGDKKTEKVEIGRDRIGLPIIIQLPLQAKTTSIVDKKAQKLRAKNHDFVGKTVSGVRKRSEEMDSKVAGPSENVAFLELGAVTPDNNYLHRLRFGIGAVSIAHKKTLISQKSIAIRTPNAVPQGVQSIDFSPESVVVDDVAEEIVKWVAANSSFSVSKEDVYTALTIAARLNTGMEDFWKTVHARQNFQALREQHPGVVVFALNTFLGSNQPLEALKGLNEFYAGLEQGQFKTYGDFVNGAREAAASLDPSVRLSINLGLGGIQHFMRQTASTILNKDAVQQVLNKISGSDDDVKDHDELLVSGDPLSVILMTPRFLTKIVEFTVKKYIPLVEDIIVANLEAVEEGLKTSRTQALALKDFNVRIRKAFMDHKPELDRIIDKAGAQVGDRLIDSVINTLNTAADSTLGLQPGMVRESGKPVIAGKLPRLREKARKNESSIPSAKKP